MDLDEIRRNLAQFAQARNWEQFHSPKNLPMALNQKGDGLL